MYNNALDSCSVQQLTMSKAPRELATLSLEWSTRTKSAGSCSNLPGFNFLQAKNEKGDIFPPGCDVGNLRVNRSHPNLHLSRLRATVEPS